MREQLKVQHLESLNKNIKSLKNGIANLKARQKSLTQQPLVSQGQDLSWALRKFLPESLVPTNVGHINKVAWPFYYSFNFDLSQTSDWPNLTANTQQVRDIVVSQEAAFLMTGIQRHADDYNSGGDLGPLAIEFRDRQSSRFFNDSPIPIQMIGMEGNPTELPMPMLILPNAKFEITLTSLLAQGATQNTEPGATGKMQFTMYGYRTRVEDAENVLSFIYGR